MRRPRRLPAGLTALALLLTLCSCAGTPPGAAPAPEGPRPLTEEELARAAEALASAREEGGTPTSTEVSCFFTSLYDSPEELDLAEFLRYFPAGETLGPEDAAEFAALAALPGFPWAGRFDGETPRSPEELPVPVHRVPEEAMDAALEKWAGISLADISDRTGTLYLEEYRAFYTFTSDFGPGSFPCAGGEVEGDTARLWSEAAGDSGRYLLTLGREGAHWYIRSYQLVPSGEGEPPAPAETPFPAELADLLRGLTAEDIGYVSWFGPNEPPAPEEVARLIRAAAEHPAQAPSGTPDGPVYDGVWSLDFYLAPRDQPVYEGDDAVHLMAGLREDLVEIFAGADLPGGRLLVEDAALYCLIRTGCDTPDRVDAGAYARYRSTVDAYYDARLADAWGGAFSAWELTCLQPAGENAALGARAYRMAAVYRADPPEDALRMLAGGAYVDSALRAHGLDWFDTYLVTMDDEALGLVFHDGEGDWDGLAGFTTREELRAYVAAQTPPF